MSDRKFKLKAVVTPRDEREWLDLPKRIYKQYPQWICPLDNDIRKVFDKSRNELFADGEAIRWTAYDQSGNAVGRIAAFYDKEHAYSYEQPTGGCGFFEAIDDQELADTLFDAAREWLKARGMEAMDGPVNFGSRDSWWGLEVTCAKVRFENCLTDDMKAHSPHLGNQKAANHDKPSLNIVR